MKKYETILCCVGCSSEETVIRYSDQQYAELSYICPDCCYERDRERSLGKLARP